MAECEQVIAVLANHPQIRATSAPTLLHPDFNKRNIFVSVDDPTKITAVIDWQGTGVEPAFMYAVETPDFAEDPYDGMMLGLDPTEDANTLHKTERDSKYFKDQELCCKFYEVYIRGFVPKIASARSLDENLTRLFRLCLSSWRYGAVVMRDELIKISERWVELGLEGSYPYLWTPEELSKHQEQYNDYEIAQKLKMKVMKILGTDSDGWVPTNVWEESKIAHQSMLDLWLRSAEEDKGMTWEKACQLWPFDIK
jgi:hypothetical protein